MRGMTRSLTFAIACVAPEILLHFTKALHFFILRFCNLQKPYIFLFSTSAFYKSSTFIYFVLLQFTKAQHFFILCFCTLQKLEIFLFCAFVKFGSLKTFISRVFTAFVGPNFLFLLLRTLRKPSINFIYLIGLSESADFFYLHHRRTSI